MPPQDSLATQDGSALAALDFSQLIGGPLCAVVDAQSRSSMSTLRFLRDPRIVTEDGNIRNVVFKYKKQIPGGGEQDAELQVPILTIVPIPFLRVKEAKIQFHAKIGSTFTKDQDESDTGAVNIDADFDEVKIKANFAHSKSSHEGLKREDEYSMDITVTAVQDLMPAGLERVLNLLEHCIQDRPPAKK